MYIVGKHAQWEVGRWVGHRGSYFQAAAQSRSTNELGLRLINLGTLSTHGNAITKTRGVRRSAEWEEDGMKVHDPNNESIIKPIRLEFRQSRSERRGGLTIAG